MFSLDSTVNLVSIINDLRYKCNQLIRSFVAMRSSIDASKNDKACHSNEMTGLIKNGGDDETRTRDLRRDRPAF